MKKYYIVGLEPSVDKLFKKRGYESVDNEEDADFVIFTGGADIYPYLYGERPLNDRCYYSLKRDQEEIRLFKKLPPKMPKVGICRGAQLFNILCGGSLWQHVDRHLGVSTHPIKDFATGRILNINSVHHQMMI